MMRPMGPGGAVCCTLLSRFHVSLCNGILICTKYVVDEACPCSRWGGKRDYQCSIACFAEEQGLVCEQLGIKGNFPCHSLQMKNVPMGVGGQGRAVAARAKAKASRPVKK